jgi:hypothetical protein
VNFFPWPAELLRKAAASFDAIAEIRHVFAGTWKKRSQRKPNLDWWLHSVNGPSLDAEVRAEPGDTAATLPSGTGLHLALGLKSIVLSRQCSG